MYLILIAVNREETEFLGPVLGSLLELLKEMGLIR
jgi:hypothetical protein